MRVQYVHVINSALHLPIENEHYSLKSTGPKLQRTLGLNGGNNKSIITNL